MYLCDCHMPCIIRNDALDLILVNMYGFAEPKILGLLGTWPQLGVSDGRYTYEYCQSLLWWILCIMNIHKMDKMMETVVKDTRFFIMGHHLPVIQLLSILE